MAGKDTAAEKAANDEAHAANEARKATPANEDAHAANDARKAESDARKDARKDEKDARKEARKARMDELEAQLDREEALAAVPQKVIDPNEAAALETITGQVPIRDTSDAPPPGQLGPHSETESPVADSADVNTTPEKGDG